MSAVKQYMQSQIDQYEQKVIEALLYEGDGFQKRARRSGNYLDKTANLRASIGFIILKNGREIYSHFEGGASKGVEEGKKVAEEVAQRNPKGFVLIGVAGMSYAAAVESKGYDVITGSAPDSKQIKDLLGSIKINK